MATQATSGCNTAELMAVHRSYAEDSGSLEFSEMTFRRALLVELKRAGGSNRPFILMLVSIAELPSSRHGYSPRRSVVESLAASIRDTDMMGWYKSSRTVGVLLTEVVGTAREAIDAVMERLNEKLASSISEEDLTKLNIAIYLLPERMKPAASASLTGVLENFRWPVADLGPAVVENPALVH